MNKNKSKTKDKKRIEKRLHHNRCDLEALLIIIINIKYDIEIKSKQKNGNDKYNIIRITKIFSNDEEFIDIDDHMKKRKIEEKNKFPQQQNKKTSFIRFWEEEYRNVILLFLIEFVKMNFGIKIYPEQNTDNRGFKEFCVIFDSLHFDDSFSFDICLKIRNYINDQLKKNKSFIINKKFLFNLIKEELFLDSSIEIDFEEINN